MRGSECPGTPAAPRAGTNHSTALLGGMPQKVVTAGEKRFSEDGVKTFTNGNKKGGDDQSIHFKTSLLF